MIDRRVRLRPKAAAENYVYGDKPDEKTLMSILRLTNGMVWNYTPNITETRQANYEMDQPIHTNSGFNNYKNSSNPLLTVTGTFHANTGTEALYLLACITFLRSSMLMDFGRRAAMTDDPDKAVVGTPPPVLLFSAYGRYMYNDIPVIIKNVIFNYPEDVHYVQVPVDTSTSIVDYDLSYIQKYYNEERGVNTASGTTANAMGINIQNRTIEQKDSYTLAEVNEINRQAANIQDGNIHGGVDGTVPSYPDISGGVQQEKPQRREPNKENNVWVPNKMSITVQLEQQPTPAFMSKKFNLNDFKRGNLLRRGGYI